MTTLGRPLLSVPASRASTSSFAVDLGLGAAADPSWLPQALRDEDQGVDHEPLVARHARVRVGPGPVTRWLPPMSCPTDRAWWISQGCRTQLWSSCSPARQLMQSGIRAKTSEFRWLAAVARDGDVSSVCDLDVEALEAVCPTGSQGDLGRRVPPIARL